MNRTKQPKKTRQDIPDVSKTRVRAPDSEGPMGTSNNSNDRRNNRLQRQLSFQLASAIERGDAAAVKNVLGLGADPNYGVLIRANGLIWSVSPLSYATGKTLGSTSLDATLRSQIEGALLNYGDSDPIVNALKAAGAKIGRVEFESD